MNGPLSAGLEQNGCRVVVMKRDYATIRRLSSQTSPLILMYVDEFGAGALSWCRDVRAAVHRSRICVFFDQGSEMEMIVALEMGADFALRRPVSERRLAAQLQALDRNEEFQSEPADGEVLQVSAAARSATLEGRVLELTDSEFDLLLLLWCSRGRVLSREDIKRETRGLSHDSRDRSIDLSVVRLRRKLGDDAQHPRLIKTVRGRGYMLVAAVS